MEACRNPSYSRRSAFCWIAADSAGNYLKCGGKEECRAAAQNWGNCKFASCAFYRAPKSYGKSCEGMNANKVNQLKSECRRYSFEKWTRDYSTPRQLYSKFNPCVGQIIEGETKKVIKYCLCYNSCGNSQTVKGDCEVQGLDRRLDFGANMKTTYKTMYVSLYIFVSMLT